MTEARSGEQLLEVARRIAPVVREGAEASERQGRLTREVVAALQRERLFRAWIPRTFAGDELDLPASLALFEAVARLDGATGWTVMIGVGGGLFAAVMEPTAAKEVFGPPEAVIAGSGTPAGRALRVEGGYRASGRWAYASGAHHATWFTANCVVHDERGPAAGPDGGPLIRAMAFPREAVEVIPAWEVGGMRGTGSDDFVVEEVFVPAARTFNVFTDAPHEGGPLYRFPFASIAEVSFAAVALGVGGHGLEAFVALAREKRRPLVDRPILEEPGVALLRAEAEVTLAAARAWFFEVAARAWGAVEGGRTLDEGAMREVRAASIHAADAAARAVDSVYRVAGTSPLSLRSEFGRCWRDVHAVRQHASLSPLGLG